MTRLSFPQTAALALLQMRQARSMLFVTTLGMLVAVMLACAVPLYSRIALTAGLRSVLHPSSETANLTVHASMNAVSHDTVSGLDEQIRIFMEESLGNFVQHTPQFSIQLGGFPLLSVNSAFANDSLTLSGYSTTDAQTHVKMMQGRLPHSTDSTLEIAITPETAASLHLHVGSSFSVPLSFFVHSTFHNGNVVSTPTQQNLTLHVTGIYEIDKLDDAFWHGYDNNPLVVGHQGLIPSLQFDALVSNETLLTQLNTIVFQRREPDLTLIRQTTDLYWYYNYDTTHVSIDQLDSLLNDIHNWQDVMNQNFGAETLITLSNPVIASLDLTGSTLSIGNHVSSLETYRNQIGVVQLPLTIFLFLSLGLVLFFISLMASLLIERQTENTALLRSRGASKSQIFSIFAVQGICSAIVALLIGPILTLLVVTMFVYASFSPSNRGALNILSTDILGTLWRLRAYALLAAFFALVTMIVTIVRSINVDVLVLRREASRSTHRPLWQRLHLDIVAAVVALTGYVVSFYLTNVQGVPQNARISVLIVAPLSLIAPIFFLLGTTLLLLRFFPPLLRLSARIAVKGRGAVALLALTQTARKPHTPVRMTLLLTLTLTFTIFSLIFSATQAQHGTDIANYIVGADFSGTLANAHNTDALATQTTLFRHIRGVTSASVGYAGTITISSANIRSSSAQIRAIDATTFAQTALWPSQDTQDTQDTNSSLASLMRQLMTPRTSTHAPLVPVVVDSLLEHQLDLQNGTHIQLVGSDATSVQGVIIGQVQHIPTVNDSTTLTGNATFSLSSGILVDYDSYQTALRHVAQSSIAPNYVWLRTKSDAALLTSVRHALTLQQTLVNPLADRYALLQQLQSNPLTFDLTGILTIGILMTLVLALIGSVVTSWEGARGRITSFAVLRALGTDTGQVARIFLWEQGVVYVSALLSGSIFGWLLSATVVPALLVTNLPLSTVSSASPTSSDITGGDMYALQHAISTQLVVSPSLLGMLIVLVVICTVTLGIMMRVVTQPTLGQRLRLNED